MFRLQAERASQQRSCKGTQWQTRERREGAIIHFAPSLRVEKEERNEEKEEKEGESRKGEKRREQGEKDS